MSWLLLALLSAFFAALVAIFAKIGLEQFDANTATAIRAVIMAIFLLMVIGLQGKFHDIKPILANQKALTFIVLSGVAGALSWLCYFAALKTGKVSQIVPIDRLSVVFALLLALILLKESVSLTAGIGAVLIVLGGILVAL